MAEADIHLGIVCDATRIQRWQLLCMKELMTVPGVKISVVLDTCGMAEVEKPSSLHRWWSGRDPTGSALALEDASSLLSGIPQVPLSANPARSVQEELRRYTCDIILQLGTTDLHPSLRAMPQLGFWRFVHGGDPAIADGSPGLWEVLHDAPVTSAMLRRESATGEDAWVLREGWFRTILPSVDKTMEAVLMCSAHWPAQVCHAIRSGDADATKGRTTGAGTCSFFPTNAEMLRLLWKQFRNKRQRRKTSRVQEEWNIGVLPQPIASFLEDKPSLNVRWLPAPGKSQYRSSPFGRMNDGQLNVLYEKFHRKTGKGVIARLRPKRDNNLKRSRTLLEGDEHLTWPYIVEHEGAVYVLLQQASRGRVDLYLLDEEQTVLTYHRTLLNEALFSPTLFQHEGRWWLFGTKKPLADTSLHAYYAQDPEGPFSPHPLNPVKVDIRSARPGGTPFHVGNQLWRPARDSSVEHHGRIALNRVTALSPTHFSEETVKFVDPLMGSWSHAMRTISAVGDITLVDGMRDLIEQASRRSMIGNKDRRKPRKRH